MIKRQLKTVLFVVPLIVVLIAFEFIVRFGDISFEAIYVVRSAEDGLASVTVALFMLSYVMTTDEYSDFRKGKAELPVCFMIWLFFLAFSLIGLLFDDNLESLVFSTGLCGIMLCAFSCGFLMTFLLTAVTTLIVRIYGIYGAPADVAAIMVAVSGVILCLAFRNGYTAKKCWCAAAFVILARSITGAIETIATPPEYFSTECIILSIVVSILFPAIIATYFFLRQERIRIMEGELTQRNSDLALAHDIQLSAVPTDFPSSKTLSAYGTMIPATDVGGDFYDYFNIKRNLVAFVIADVSDKGLPAALFMMKAKGIIKSTAMVEYEPDRILMLSNRELCTNNAVEQFVTVWIGILDTDTGILRYSNAGHTPPYIKRRDGSFEKLEVPKGLMMGVNPGVRYKAMETMMGDGDTLFIYTDGVNEAFNSSDEEYGHERLLKALDASASLGPKEITENVFNDVRKFTGNIPASDDITMFCIKTSRSGYGCITVPADNGNLDQVTAFLEENLVTSGCPLKDAMKLEIVAEEIFVNICSYAYEEEGGEVTMLCRYGDGEAKIVFYDKGRIFDPVSRDELVIDEDINNWKIGGFGIHMIKNLVDHANYKRLGGRNVLTVWRKTGATEEEDDA